MAQSSGSPILLLPVQSEAAPQTREDPKGCWRGTWKGGALISRIPCVGPLVYSLLSVLYSCKQKVPRDVTMG